MRTEMRLPFPQSARRVSQKFSGQFLCDQTRFSAVKGARQSLQKPTALRWELKDTGQFRALRDQSRTSNPGDISQELISGLPGMISQPLGSPMAIAHPLDQKKLRLNIVVARQV